MRAPTRRFALTVTALVPAAIPAAAQTTATVTGTLAEAASAPSVTGGGIGYWVQVVRVASGVSYTGSTNSSGQYTIANIPPGTYVVQVSQAGNDYVKEVHDNIVCVSSDCNIDMMGTRVVLGAGTTTTINFAVARGGKIAGTVRRAAPAAAAPVRAERASGDLRRVLSRDDGSHRITLRALEPLELELGEPGDRDCRATWAGYAVDGDALGKLPVGASIDPAGTFYWQPGPGFVGSYDLMFVRTGCDGGKQRLPVTIAIGSK
jgi:hypothetical protein